MRKQEELQFFTPEEKEINTLEKFIKNPDRTVLNDEFIESLKLAVEKLKEVKQMERLTKRIEDENTLLTEVGDTACKCFCDNYTLSGCWECPVGKAIEKLAEYEDLEEQGLLVRLPCKVGDTV